MNGLSNSEKSDPKTILNDDFQIDGERVERAMLVSMLPEDADKTGTIVELRRRLALLGPVMPDDDE
jgi:hypothetical protein